MSETVCVSSQWACHQGHLYPPTNYCWALEPLLALVAQQEQQSEHLCPWGLCGANGFKVVVRAPTPIPLPSPGTFSPLQPHPPMTPAMCVCSLMVLLPHTLATYCSCGGTTRSKGSESRSGFDMQTHRKHADNEGWVMSTTSHRLV